MARPRKYPAPAPEAGAELAPAAPAAAAETVADLQPEEISAQALNDRFRPLTPEDVAILQQTWRDTVLLDDEESRTLTRRIAARLRRATHLELHPNCQRVTVNVPRLPGGHFVKINERPYIGDVDVWACEAQTLLWMVEQARIVDGQRMSDKGDGGASIDLDRESLAARARAIQAA